MTTVTSVAGGVVRMDQATQFTFAGDDPGQAASASAYRYLTPDGSAITLGSAGNSFVYGNGTSALPTAGLIQSLSLNVGNDASTEFVIDLSAAPADVASIDFGNVNELLSELLSDNDTFNLSGNVWDYAFLRVYAGDGVSANGGTGGNDIFNIDDIGVLDIAGDVRTVTAGGTYAGGNDRIQGMPTGYTSGTATGDADRTLSGSNAIGGNDRIESVDSGIGDFRLVEGSAIGGNDTLINCSTSYGDAQTVSSTQFTGGDDVIAGAFNAFGDAGQITTTGAMAIVGGDDIIALGSGDGTAWGDFGSPGFNNVATIQCGDDVIFGGDGNNKLYGDNGVGTTSFIGGNDRLYGGTGDDELYGQSGDDWLEGGLGSDIIDGGTGRNTVSYLFASGGVTVSLATEAAQNTGSAGIDTLRNIQVLEGSQSGDTLTAGNASTLRGQGGSDTYFIASLSDVVEERQGSGDDTVRSSQVSINLDDVARVRGDVENARLDGSQALSALGNRLNNSLYGNSGNNLLNGMAGSDRMEGGDGNDTYFIDSAGDTVIETASALSGIDEIYTSRTVTMMSNVEWLTLIDNAEASIGNALNNRILGNSAHNYIKGAEGTDQLFGGAGNDRLFGGIGTLDELTGGSGDDMFIYEALSEAGDRVLDFSSSAAGNDDSFVFSQSAFGGVVGMLSADQFQKSVADTAGNSDTRFIYETDTNILRYDVDGLGGADAIVIATLQTGATMTNADIIII